MAEGLDRAEGSVCFCQGLNGRLAPVPVSFSFQLSFLPFPCPIFLIQCVVIKLTCVLKAEFASWGFLIATVLCQ